MTKRHWNHRVVRRHRKAKSKGVVQVWLEMTEVHYRDDKPSSFAVGLSGVAAHNYVSDTWDAEAEARAMIDLRWTLDKMIEALDKPILDEVEDFK